MKITKIFFPIIIFAFIILLLCSPAKFMAVALDGALVWATILLPSLFPFIFFSRLFTTFEVTQNLSKPFSRATQKLYHCPSDSAYVFLLSVLCGYPIGAKLISDLYQDGKLSKGQAYRSVSFVSNCGPMFIIGSVGVGMLHSTKAGIIILICHILSSLLNGLIYRKSWKKFDFERLPAASEKNAQTSVSDIVFSSINSVLMVGGYVIIFFIVAEVFTSLKIFSPLCLLLKKIGINPQISEGILCGLLEITKGSKMLSIASSNLQVIVPACCFLITFGGFSTFMQSYTFLEKTGMKKSALLIQKTTQALIATALCVVASLIMF